MDQPTPSKRSYHDPVMVDEVLSWLEPASEGWIVDCTYGGGGHSRALLRRFPLARIVGIDRDPDALGQAEANPRLTLVEANYRAIADVMADERFPDLVDGILLDLGVSSHQLDESSRGFSYRSSGPLDMRMGPDAERSAAELVNSASEDELAHILWRYGEERFSRRIARAIVDQRPFSSTGELSECVAGAVPAAVRRAKHPARKTFQAIRIAVNDELAGLSEVLDASIDLCRPGGRIVVIAYHSLEDRIVKRLFADRSTTCTCPPELPVCACGAEPDVIVLTRKAQKPTPSEIAENPRARSAVLRVAERVGT